MSGERSYLDDGLVRDAAHPAMLVIPRDLCTRCGVCHVICPPDVIRFDRHDFPYIETRDCIDCGLCLKVCPGIEFDMQQTHRDMFQADFQPQRMSGTIRKAYVGYSTRPGVRQEAAAGGIVTQLLIALVNQRIVDGALVIGTDPDDPTAPLPLIARTEAEIRAAAQSKYTVVANTKVLRELKGSSEHFAFVGVACQIHGLKKLEALNKRLCERAYVTIGLACRGTMEREAVEDLARANHIALRDLRQISHRGGPFPGKFQAHFKTGAVRDLHHFDYKDGAYNVMIRMYLPDRCHLCPDYAAEFADITCSDMWLRGQDGQYLHPDGNTLVICRTERGEQIIEALIQSGDVVLTPVETSLVERSYAHLQRERKMISYLRIVQRRRRGQRAPEYGVDAAAQVNQMSWGDRLYAFTYGLTFLFVNRPRAKQHMLRLLISPVGKQLIALKLKYKQFKGARKARKLSRVQQKQRLGS